MFVLILLTTASSETDANARVTTPAHPGPIPETGSAVDKDVVLLLAELALFIRLKHDDSSVDGTEVRCGRLGRSVSMTFGSAHHRSHLP